MDSRKVIGFGKNSYVISLPKHWVKKNRVKKGDSILVREDVDGLKVMSQPYKSEEERTLVIDTNNKDFMLINTEIITGYLNGYDSMEIRGNALADTKTAQRIREIILYLAGYEIIEESANRIIAKDLIDLKQVSLESMVRRIDLIIRAMMSDMIRCFKDCDKENIFQRDDDVNRLVFLVYRLIKSSYIDPGIAKILNVTPPRLLTYWLVAMRLEKIGDQTKRIARELSSLSISKGEEKKMLTLMNRIKDDYEAVMKAFYKGNVQEAFHVEIRFKSHLKLIAELQEGKQNYELSRIAEQLKSTASSIKHIARNVGDNNG